MEFAKNTAYGQRVAHGLLGLALTDGLKNRSEFNVRTIGALHWSWDFVAPIFIGDTGYVRFHVADKRPSKTKQGRGIITLEMELVNQRGKVAQRGKGLFLIEHKMETS
jgi:3-hydroxybutyryl-CoA dehydratase